VSHKRLVFLFRENLVLYRRDRLSKMGAAVAIEMGGLGFDSKAGGIVH